MVYPVIGVGLNPWRAAVEGRVAEAGIEPGRAVLDRRGVGVPVANIPVLELVELCGRAEATHLELPEEGHGVVDFLVPFDGAPLAGADELPDSFLLVGVPDDETYILDLHSLDVAQLDDGLGGGDVGQAAERQLSLLVEFPGVPEDLDALQQEEPVVGHHKALLLFGDDRVCDVFSIDVLSVGQLGDVLPQPGRAGGGVESSVKSALVHVHVHVGAVHGVASLSLASHRHVDLRARELAAAVEVGAVKGGALAVEGGGLLVNVVLSGAGSGQIDGGALGVEGGLLVGVIRSRSGPRETD